MFVLFRILEDLVADTQKCYLKQQENILYDMDLELYYPPNENQWIVI
jgi:hypothetical protein